MRIGFFHEVDQGGARRSVVEFGKALKKNHSVDLFYVDKTRNLKDEKNFTHALFYSFKPKIWREKDWKTRLYKDTVELYKLYLLHKRIASDINSRNYDAVIIDPSKFTQSPFLLRFIKAKKLYYCQEALRMIYDPLLSTIDFLPPGRKLYEKLIRGIRKEIDKGNIVFANKILANSRFSKHNIQKAYGKKSGVCYMGVDTKSFFPKQRKKDIDVLYVGAYDYVDGYDLFEEALSHFRKKPQVKILAREKEWITDDTTLNDLYNGAKVTVCISYNEPFGLIPLESMAAGTPVIALSLGGYKESVRHGQTGYLVKKNPRILADTIKKLLRNQSLRMKMAQHARNVAVSYWDWSKRATDLEKALKDLVDEK